MPKDNREIVRAIRTNVKAKVKGEPDDVKLYLPGDEVEFAEISTEEDLQRHLDSGTITGDWFEAQENPSLETDTELLQ